MLKQNTILILLIYFCLLFPSSVFSESSFRVFQTHQPAQTLIPLIAPLYAGHAKFTAKNNSLIVKAPTAILQEIKQLLTELDKPLRNLLIEVSSSLDGDAYYQQDSVEGRIKLGDDAVISSRAPETNNPNVSIRYGKNGSVIKSTHTRRNNSRSNPDTYRARTVEGTWAFIQTGQKVPYYSSAFPYDRSDSDRRYYPALQSSVELVDVTSGFEVLATLNGSRVTLKVRQKNQSMNRQYSDRINTRSVDTIVTGELGQWIFLGAAINKINEQNNSTFYSTRRHSDVNTNYRIKVSLIEN